MYPPSASALAYDMLPACMGPVRYFFFRFLFRGVYALRGYWTISVCCTGPNRLYWSCIDPPANDCRWMTFLLAVFVSQLILVFHHPVTLHLGWDSAPFETWLPSRSQGFWKIALRVSHCVVPTEKLTSQYRFLARLFKMLVG